MNQIRINKLTPVPATKDMGMGVSITSHDLCVCECMVREPIDGESPEEYLMRVHEIKRPRREYSELPAWKPL